MSSWEPVLSCDFLPRAAQHPGFRGFQYVLAEQGRAIGILWYEQPEDLDGITQLVGTWFQDHIAPRLVRPEGAVRGIRWVSYDRPAYGGSTPHPGRDVASTAADLAGAWSWLLTVVEQAMAGGLGGMVDDDLASVAPWGFDPGQGRTPSAELWLRSDDGHVSVLDAAETALGWLREHARQG